MDSLIFNREEQKSADFRANILSDSNKLSLYLRLKEVYNQNFSGLSKEYEEVFSYKILSDKKNIKLIAGLISR